VTRESQTESWRTVAVLGVALAFSASTGPLVTLSGGIVGQALAPSPLLATLPISLLVVGVATCTVPAVLLMSRIGRRAGFMTGAAISAMGALLAAAATTKGSFALFCLATFVIGAAGAFAQQYRFAAAESVEAAHAGRAVSFVLLGGIVAGALGPEIGRRGRLLLNAECSGACIMAAVVQTAVLALLTAMRPLRSTSTSPGPALRVATTGLLRRPAFALALAGSATAYAVMSFVMTATPISMHVIDAHSLDDTARVIQSHVIAMYAPSLVTGFLVDRLGVRRMMVAGTVALLACSGVTASSRAVAAYWSGLVLLGFGWNLLFVGATVLLTRSYQPEERFRAQAVNDLAVFGGQALASLASGAVLHRFGWVAMNLAVAPLLLVVLGCLLAVGTRAFPARPGLPASAPPPG
jgi:predicted MFS family arabinose efflux permease